METRTSFGPQLLRDALGVVCARPVIYIKTYGCQQNVNDSQRIAGMFEVVGCSFTDDVAEADIVIFNTCAVREHAEQKVFGHVGALKKLKQQKQKMLIALGGCMVQQQHIAEQLGESYPFVDIVFNTNELAALPELFARRVETGKPVYSWDAGNYAIDESIPTRREDGFRAFVPIMYGCNNFCSYCVVPFVRGRERSRRFEDIELEFKQLVAQGYKDIMLLGQNVNSYGKTLDDGMTFAELLRRLGDIDGDYKIRFMTSHPKDASDELFRAIADSPRISRHIHLPVQSGSDRILKLMNRKYTVGDYLGRVEKARELIPGVSFTSDIIVGFPGEMKQDYEDTLSLIKRVGFYSLFTFIYSKRMATPAADMPDDTSRECKVERLSELNAVQDEITDRYDRAMIGTDQMCLVAAQNADGSYDCRLDNNAVVVAAGQGRLNEYQTVTANDIKKHRLYGKLKP